MLRTSYWLVNIPVFKDKGIGYGKKTLQFGTKLAIRKHFKSHFDLKKLHI